MVPGPKAKRNGAAAPIWSARIRVLAIEVAELIPWSPELILGVECSMHVRELQRLIVQASSIAVTAFGVVANGVRTYRLPNSELYRRAVDSRSGVP